MLARETAPLTRDASFLDLEELLVAPRPAGQLLEAIDTLRRRSLSERGKQPSSFTLQSVVLEYVTRLLTEEATGEIQQGRRSPQL